MDDLSILIQIGGQLEKSFNDAIRAAQSGLSGLNAAVSKEMAEAGRVSAAASKEMAAAGKMGAGASKEMAAAGRMGATASREMAAGQKEAATSARDIATAGKMAATVLKGMTTGGRGAALSAKDIATTGKMAATVLRGMAVDGKETVLSAKNLETMGKRAAAVLGEMAAEGKKAVVSTRDMAATGKGAATSAKDIATAAKKAAASLKEMAAESRRASTVSKDLLAGGPEITSLSTELAVGERGALSLSKGMATAGEMAGTASKGFLIAGAAIAAVAASAVIAGKVMMKVGQYSVQVGMDFESSMSDAAATANASTEDFAKMEQAAMEMGKTTSKTASESANALEYMALAGWDVDTSISALPSVLKMSEASGMDLGRTSDLVTDSMAALGVSVNELPNYLDVATKAQTKSNQTAEQLMEAYLGVGGTMKNLNIPITESAAALGVLANRGIKGSEAGNALNAIMVNLTTGTGQAGKMMRELGVSAFDQQGKFVGLETTLQQLNTVLQGYNEEQRNAALAAIGGKQHVDALNDLMAGLNTTNEKGISEWAALTDELKDCSGSLQAMRDMKLDNLEGDMKTLESATQDAGIKIYKHLNTPLRDFAQFGTQAVYRVSDALESDGFSGMAGVAGNALADGFGIIMERLPEFLATATVSIASFLVNFAAELPASLLSGIIKGVPRLLKALPRLGIDIVKAIIRGILSMGSAPLRAIKSLIFGGEDQIEIQKVSTDATKDYASGIKEDTVTAAVIPVALQQAQTDNMEMRGNALSAAEQNGSMVGQSSNTSNIAGNAVPITKLGVADEEAWKVQAERMPVGVPMDAAQPADVADTKGVNAPVIVDAPPALQATKDFRIGDPEEIGAETQIDNASLAGVSTETSPIPHTGIGTQIPIDANEASMEAFPLKIDAADIGENLTVPPIDAVQDITLTPSVTMPDIPAEAIPDISMENAQISPEAVPDISMENTRISPEIIPDISMEKAQISPEVIPNISMENAQISPEIVPDISMENMQIPPGALPEMPIKAALIPATSADITPDRKQASDASGITGVFHITSDTDGVAARGAADSQVLTEAFTQDVSIPTLEGTQSRKIPLPPVDMDRVNIGNLAKPTIQALGIDRNAVALSSQMGAVDAFNNQTFVDAIGGAVDTSPIDVGVTEIHGNRNAQRNQLPPQEAIQAVPVEALRDTVANMTNAQNTSKSKEVLPRISSGMEPSPTMVMMQEPAGSVEAISRWGKSIADLRQTAWMMSELDISPKRSIIDEILDIVLNKKKDQDTPAPSGKAPTFVYSPTIHVEGSSSVKKDVNDVNQMGIREFGEMMEAWLKQNARVKFG